MTVCVLLATCTVAAYRHSFAVPFQFDDLNAIVDNPAVHLTQFEGAGLARAVTTSRPLAALSFALNWWLTGSEPTGFHVVNLLVHLCASLLVYRVARQLLHAVRETQPVSSPHAVASLTALLFALHPVQTQAVTYVVQRMASLGAFFALLSTTAWLTAGSARRPGPWRGGAWCAWLAACACKQNFVVLPLVLVVMDLVLGGAAARRGRGLVAMVVAVGLGGGVALAMRGILAAEYRRMGLGPWETLVEQPRVLCEYLSLLVWPLPSRLRVDRFWELSGTWFEWRTALATAALVGLALGSFAVRRRAPVFTFAVAWFLGLLLVEQTVLPVDLYFEHRLYLPSFGPLLWFASGVAGVTKRMGLPLASLGLPVLGLLGLATDQRNGLWVDPAALHAQAVEAGQGTPRSWDVLGVARLEAGDLVGAESAFQAALERSVNDAVALTNLAQVAERRGDVLKAEVLYRRAIDATPDLRQPRVDLVLLLARRGRFEEAAQSAEAWLARSPKEPHAWYAQGVVRGLQGRHEAAREAFSRAFSYDGAFEAALRDRGASALALGLWAEAAADFERVVALRPRAPQAWRELGYARERAGDRVAAVRAYDVSLGLDPKQQPLAEYVAQLRKGL